MRVCEAVLSLFRNTNDVTPGKSTGRRRKTTARHDRQLILVTCRGRTRCTESLREEWQRNIGGPISRETVNQRLVRRGYRARRPTWRPCLTQRRKGLQVRFARVHHDITFNHWRHVLLGDDSRFLLHRVDGRVRVRRFQGETLHEDCIGYTRAGGGGSLNVCGACHVSGKSQLVILDRNVTEASYLNILRKNLLPWARQTFSDNFCYQDDNIPAYRAWIVRDFMEQQGVIGYTSLHSHQIATLLVIYGTSYNAPVLFLLLRFEITNSSPKNNGCTIESWEWISNFIPHFVMGVISYLCRD